ncbi:MAG: hypothetical protein NW215_10640 [Hyphomicrobiales bacterium]|nr:hypothetical protein [Hyphomicrobiales bacterium]
MTDTARVVFNAIAAAGGPSLKQIEAIARGELIVAKPVTTARVPFIPRGV